MKKLEELGITPAPWHIDLRGCVSQENGMTVADTYSDEDAALMSAAPELYEALRLAYEEAAGERIVVPKRGWIDRAKTALGKAGGAE